MDVTPDQINSLASKLEGLDLTEAEQAILDSVLDRAAEAGEPEVAGYYIKFEHIDGEPAQFQPKNPTAQKFFDIIYWVD